MTTFPGNVATMDTRLYVAAGGGGDALAAVMLHSEAAPGARAVVATYAWDRLLIDPLPGPRPASDFSGLEEVATSLWRLTPESAPIPPAGSSLPRMAAELDIDLVLLDPYEGAVGMAAALSAAVQVYKPSSVTIVDVGGDVLARGDEPQLKSPLADLLALAACTRLDTEVDVAVLGVGLDGELPGEYTLARIAAHGGRRGPRLGPDAAEAIAPLFAWHPSEASGMLAAAACGVRGTVEVRDAGTHILLSDTAPESWLVPAPLVAAASELARRLVDTSSLLEVEEQVRAVAGRSELDYERRKAVEFAGRPLRSSSGGDDGLEERYRDFLARADERGSDYVTIRRLAEQIGAPRGSEFEAWRTRLIAAEPHRYARPLWSLRKA